MRFAISRRSVAWLLATGLLVLVGAGLFFQGRPPGLGEHAAGPAFALVGHRGAAGVYPANTLRGFRHALRVGVTTLHMDLRRTADGVVVTHHGARLDPDRTRNAQGDWIVAPGPAIAALSYEALQAYDVGTARPGSELAERFPDRRALDGVRVPSLREAIELAESASGGEIRYSLEIHHTPDDPSPKTFVRAVLAILKEAEVAERTTIRALDWRVLAAVRRQAPAVARAYATAARDRLNTVRRGNEGPSPWLDGLDVDIYAASVPRTIAAAESGAADELEAVPPWRVVWSPQFRDLRAPDVKRAHGLGLKVVAWTVNDTGTMASLIDLGVDGIVTDDPARLREVMAEKGLALPAQIEGAGDSG